MQRPRKRKPRPLLVVVKGLREVPILLLIRRQRRPKLRRPRSRPLRKLLRPSLMTRLLRPS